MAETNSWSEICEVTKRDAPKEIRLCAFPYSSGLNINDISFSVLCSMNTIETELLAFLKEVLQRAYYWEADSDSCPQDRSKQFRRIVMPGPDGSKLLYNLSFERKLGSKDVDLKLRFVQKIDERWINRIISVTALSPNTIDKIFIANRGRSTHQIDGVACLLALMPEAVSISSRSGAETIEEQIRAALPKPVILVTESRDPVEALILAVKKTEERRSLKELGVTKLAGVLIHERVRKVCPSCAKPTAVEEAILSKVQTVFHPYLPKTYLLGRGCDLCKQSGYNGTLGLTSWMPITDFERKFFAGERIDVDAAASNLYQSGYRPIMHDGLDQICAGNTSFEEVIAVSSIVSPVYISHLSSRKATKPKKSATPRILIVEDNEDQRVVVESLFESAGYEVSTAIDGVQALSSLQERSADLVVCDLMMPKMNGVQFLSKLRESSLFNSVPVLILTAAHNPELEATLLQSGAADYCEKNVTKKVLLARVERLLNTAR